MNTNGLRKHNFLELPFWYVIDVDNGIYQEKRRGRRGLIEVTDKQKNIKIGRDEVTVTYNQAMEIVAVCIDVQGYDEVILFRDEHFAREEDSEDREINFAELGMDWDAERDGYDDR